MSSPEVSSWAKWLVMTSRSSLWAMARVTDLKMSMLILFSDAMSSSFQVATQMVTPRNAVTTRA